MCEKCLKDMSEMMSKTGAPIMPKMLEQEANMMFAGSLISSLDDDHRFALLCAEFVSFLDERIEVQDRESAMNIIVERILYVCGKTKEELLAERKKHGRKSMLTFEDLKNKLKHEEVGK